MKQKIITYQSPDTGRCINVTEAQKERMEAAGVWPKDHHGCSYCQVHIGLHSGTSTMTDAEIGEIIAGEHMDDVLAGSPRRFSSE